jgi:hypothetical protein
VLSNEEDEYLTARVTYEAPVETESTTVSASTSGVESSTITNEEDVIGANKIRRIRMEKANEITTNDYDDYEMQEKYCKSEITSENSKSMRRFQHEEEANDANV